MKAIPFTILIPIAIALVLALAAGAFFLLQPKDSSPLPTVFPTSTARPLFSQLPDTPTMTAKPTPVLSATPKNNTISASLGKEFTLRENQTATITGTSLTVKLTQLINGYCPDGVNCFWSGMGLELEYRLGQEIKKGINLMQAFGYRITIVKTDYNTYATLIVEK